MNLEQHDAQLEPTYAWPDGHSNDRELNLFGIYYIKCSLLTKAFEDEDIRAFRGAKLCLGDKFSYPW